uniref:Uncharacterized protein n=1 Tax=Arundo donax TaxID=35708 RepID=A0A0A8YI14_ARUDO
MIDELMLLRKTCDANALRSPLATHLPRQHGSTGDNRPPAPFRRRGTS